MVEFNPEKLQDYFEWLDEEWESYKEKPPLKDMTELALMDFFLDLMKMFSNSIDDAYIDAWHEKVRLENTPKQHESSVPKGFYTAQEAAKILKMKTSTFRYYIRQGKIKRYVPPLRTQGYYDKKEIDRLANGTTLE